MTTRDRRQREIAEREQLFLKKTHELVCQGGLLQLQMARIADACDYATGTLYHHFASKEDLLVALLAERSEERIAYFRRAAAWNGSPRDRMFAFAAADVAFVERNPQYFRIAQLAVTEVVWSAASQPRRQAFLHAMEPAGELVLGIIADAVRDGDLDLGDVPPEEVALGLWSMVVGTHTLVHAAGLLEFFNVKEPYRAMGRNIHGLLNGLGWRPLFTINDGAACERYARRLMSDVFGETADN